MESKQEMVEKAKSFIDTSPDDAVKTFLLIYEVYSDQFDSWDAFYTLKAMKKTVFPNLNFGTEIALKFKDDVVGNLYGWLIYEKCVKGKNRIDLLANEKYINLLPQISPQKNRSEDDKYICPTTISLLSISKVYSKPSLNAFKIESFLSQLNVHFLTDKPGKSKDNNEDEFASDFEQYCSLRTKALLKIKKFQECKDLSKLALQKLNKFHYNNDTWFNMRIALSEEGLGNHESCENLLIKLLESKAGSDKWFLYRDISEVYDDQGDYEKAWKYAVYAAYYGNEPHFLIGLYLLQARILFKLKRPTEGKILAELIAAILKEHEWNDRSEYIKLFNYYNIDRSTLLPVSEIIKKARLFWQNERYGNKPKQIGTIISIHKNGKFGRIKDQNNNIIGFQKRDLVKKMKSIENLTGTTVEFFIMESFDGKNIAENISITEQPATPKPDNLVGMTFEGTVKNVAEFGILFRLQGAPNGLLHKNNLPHNLRDCFKEVFTQGKKVKVKIEKITEKGIQLMLAENI